MTLIIVLAVLTVVLGYYTKVLNDKSNYKRYITLTATFMLSLFLLVAINLYIFRNY